MINRKLLRTVFAVCMMVSSVSAVFSDQLAGREFSSWAEGAELYYFDSGNNLTVLAGILTDKTGRDEAGRLIAKIPWKDFLPWTEQLRIGGFAAGDRLIVGVNRGYPLLLHPSAAAGLRFEAPGADAAEDYLDLSEGRTLGSVFTKNNSVYFHLYRDSIFGKGATASASGGGVHLVELSFPGEDARLSPAGLNFAEAGNGWEPVEFISTPEGGLAAWKYSDEKKTRFRYIRHDAAGSAVKEIDEDYFRDEYPLISFRTAPFALRGFIRAVRENILDEVLGNPGEVFLELSAADSQPYTDKYPAFFYDENGGRAGGKYPVILPASGTGDLWYILAGAAVIRCGENISLCRLPELPEGFKYDRLWTDSEAMIVGWEETKFPFIGRSGMMYINMRDIILE